MTRSKSQILLVEKPVQAAAEWFQHKWSGLIAKVFEFERSSPAHHPFEKRVHHTRNAAQADKSCCKPPPFVRKQEQRSDDEGKAVLPGTLHDLIRDPVSSDGIVDSAGVYALCDPPIKQKADQ